MYSPHTRRLSQSYSPSVLYSPHDSVDSPFTGITEAERNVLIARWGAIPARDIIEPRVVVIDEDAAVEEACEALLSENIECLVVMNQSSPSSTDNGYEGTDRWMGLFDFSDVNAFLTLAATRHTLRPDEIKENKRSEKIVEAAKAGKVPVKLVSNFSDKNPLIILPYDASMTSLLEVFAYGAHRVFLRGPGPASVPVQSRDDLLGMVSDRRLLAWFATFAKEPPLQGILEKPLAALAFPLLNIHTAVVIASSSASLLDAMRLMSEEGVSSVAVVDETSGMLIGAVSVTDIGKIVVPTQSNQILGASLKAFVMKVKEPDGSTDGVDKYPVYSVFPSTSLVYTIEKLLATNAHRLFVTDESEGMSSISTSTSPENLTGIISVVDILSLFAHVAKIPDVDPSRMRRHRRASSASSQSSGQHERDVLRSSRSGSRTGSRRSPSFGVSSSSPLMSAVNVSNSPIGLQPRGLGMSMSIPDISGSLGGSGFGFIGRRGSLNASLRARKKE